MFNQYGLLMKSSRSGTPRTIKDPGLGKFLYDLYIECGADLTEEFVDYILAVASGERTNNEKNGYREISIFKDGVTL